MVIEMNQPSKKTHILVIEDNEDVRKVLSLYLKKNGHEISEAGDGLAGLQAAEEEKPDLVLLDVLLPRIDGIEVLKKLRKNPSCADIPVIMMSAVLQTSDIQNETQRLNISGFLQKPFQVRHLLKMVKEALASKEEVEPLEARAQEDEGAPKSKQLKNKGKEKVPSNERRKSERINIPMVGTLEQISLPKICEHKNRKAQNCLGGDRETHLLSERAARVCRVVHSRRNPRCLPYLQKGHR